MKNKSFEGGRRGGGKGRDYAGKGPKGGDRPARDNRSDRGGRPRTWEKGDRPARQSQADGPQQNRLTTDDSQRQGHKASLWGVHAVTEAWLNPARAITALYVSDNALEEFKPVLERARTAGLKRPDPVPKDRRAMDHMLPPGAVHQGLALDAAPLEEIFVQDLIVRAASREKSIIVMLDQVTDPHNVGAILRSASAFGAIGLVMQSRHAPEINGTLAKAACGAAEHIPVAYETNLSRAMEALQDEGFIAIGLDERGEKTMAELAVPDKTLLVLGAEGRGLRQNLREHCNIVTRLPTEGAILSLNVSNAAAVALYALVAEKS